MKEALRWVQAGEAIAQLFGLRFPKERRADLKRALASAAGELKSSEDALLDALIAGALDDRQRDTLASHLTVGETYFFRAPELLDALREHVLPMLVRERAGSRRLRLWSAGCCTGEEPYTLAMLLRESIPDIDAWQVSILATDVNPRFLHKARQGIYGEWSFRATPEALRRRYFRTAGKGLHAIDPAIRGMVEFMPLNLSEGAYPSIATGTNAMDLVLCRNVLMYFEESKAREALLRLRASLCEGGLLSLAPCESAPPEAGFATLRFGDATFHRRADGMRDAKAEPSVAAPHASATVRSKTPPAFTERTSAATPLRQAPVASANAARAGTTAPQHPLGYEAKLRADEGRLHEALALCDRWIAGCKLDVAAHYLRGLVCMELGDGDAAAASLQRCAYLAPDEPMVHFSTGNLHRLRGRPALAQRAWRHALVLAAPLGEDLAVPYSDGLPAAQLRALLEGLIAAEGPDEQAA